MAILAGPGSFLDQVCALLADVVQLSSQKSAFKARTKIQLNLIDFSVAVWAGPGCFLDPACALLVDVVQVSSQKSGFKAGNQAAKFTEKNQPNLVELWVAVLAGPGRFLDSACALLADVVQVSNQKSAFKMGTKIQPYLEPYLVEFSVTVWAGQGCFLDPACALLVDVVQVSNQKSGFKAGNQATKFTETNSTKFG